MDDKIQYLLENRDLAAEPILFDVQSNCWGTAAWVLGIENKIEDMYEDWLDRENLRPINKEVIIAEGRPGYIGRKPMEALLANCRQTENPDIISYYDENDILMHCSVPTSKRRVFHQRGCGGPWESVSMRSYLRIAKSVKFYRS